MNAVFSAVFLYLSPTFFKRTVQLLNSVSSRSSPGRKNHFSKAFVNSLKNNFVYQLPLKINGLGIIEKFENLIKKC